MKIFITGASGFVGGEFVKKFKGQHEIVAMARDERAIEKVKKLGVTPQHCDLLNVTAKDLEDCDVVIHCAALAKDWGSDEAFYNTNVLGTEHLLNVAKAAHVKRFIFIGTEAAMFKGDDLVNIDETYPPAFDSPYPYSRTKAKAEDLVLKANSPDFMTISLRPRFVWGPNDTTILPIIIQMIKEKKFIWIDQGQYLSSITHINNLIYAIELALTHGKGGEAYFIADDERIIMKDFLQRYVATQGVTTPQLSLPKPLVRTLAAIVYGVWKMFRLKSKPPLVPFAIAMMSAECTVNTDKAKRELGYQPVIHLEEGLKAMTSLTS